MNEKGASNFFDRFAVTFDSFYDGKRNKIIQTIDKKFRNDMFERFRLTFNNLTDLSNRTVLDIGCGSGIYMFEALKRGVGHVTGVDPAPGMIDLAKNKLSSSSDFNGRYDLILGTFPQIELTPHDYVIIMGVMDYIKDPLEFLNKLKGKFRVAALISFPSNHWLRAPIRKIRYNFRDCPVYFYDQESIRQLIDKNGFKKFSIKENRWCWYGLSC